MPGALRLLQELKHAGLKRVLVTGSGQNSLLSRISTEFPEMFRDELRITSANVQHGKPHPEPYLKAMDLAMVEPWQSVAFENAPLGVESAIEPGHSLWALPLYLFLLKPWWRQVLMWCMSQWSNARIYSQNCYIQCTHLSDK